MFGTRQKTRLFAGLSLALVLGLWGCQHRPPQANFTLDSSTVFVEEPVSFDASASLAGDGEFLEYNWDFGDGTTGQGVAAMHGYQSPGQYTVTLTVRNDKGKSDSASRQVMVEPRPEANQPPSAAFSFSPEGPAVDESVSFSDESSDPDGQVVSWQWDFGDGSTSEEQNPSHTYAETGSFTVTLSVTDDQGGTGEATQAITVTQTSGSKLESFPAPGGDPRGAAFDGNQLWVSDAASLELTRIDPASGEVTRTLEVDWSLPEDIAWDGEFIWAVENAALELLKIDPEDGAIVESFDAPGEDPTGLTFDGEFLWMVDAISSRIFKIDPQNGDSVENIEAPGTIPLGLAFDGEFLWLADPEEGRLFKIDPDTATVEDVLSPDVANPTGLAFDGEFLWQTDDLEQVIQRTAEVVIEP